ncbi:AraC family transcriptional regulator [Paenibacillus thalictri]|uniref:AraC family transcriptional regulator n=1 Tax=Paenibacillus thalictri TaxID=2527873 RepID=A0A4V2J488_9BACL|nr:AraC family transcriptional regulator [Paenibacillus thalictri]TBL78551.1 AraC family transcriptional regulator [Paenibacillus thalictri]
MNTSQFAAGRDFLNETVQHCTTGSLSFHVHYWGWQHAHYSNKVHRHSYYEVCFVLTGEGEYQDDETVYTLRPGSMFVSRPGIWHQIRSDTGLGLMYVAYELDKDGCSEAYDRQYGERLDDQSVYIESGLDQWAALYWLGYYSQAATRPYGDDEIKRMGGILLSGLLHPFIEHEQPASRNPSKRTSETHSAIVRLSKQYIRDNLSRPLRAEDVARYMNVSARQLSRLFQMEGGDTFVSYVRKERLRFAEMLLKTTLHSLKEIAEDAGFGSVHYFTSVFTEQLGVPPGEYRKRHMADIEQREKI